MYIIRDFLKMAELNDYKEGCVGNTKHSSLPMEIKADTIEGVKDRVINWFGVTLPDVDFNSCDEDGRVDIQLMENGEGDRATKSELIQWKDGKLDLYACTYTGQLEQLTEVEF